MKKTVFQQCIKQLFVVLLLVCVCFSCFSCAGKEVRYDREIGKMYRKFVVRGNGTNTDSIEVIPPYIMNDYLDYDHDIYELTESDAIDQMLARIKEIEQYMMPVDDDEGFFTQEVFTRKEDSQTHSIHCSVKIERDKEDLLLYIAEGGIAILGDDIVCFESEVNLGEVMDDLVALAKTGELILDSAWTN